MTEAPADQIKQVRSCAFGPLTIRYDARVLTPRPWTLLQSRWAAELAADSADSADSGDGPILELCAGAGQIGLAAAVLSGRALVQVEADPVAAAYARSNAAAAGRADVEVRLGRIDSALEAGERFSILLADPPYLPSAAVADWPDDPTSAIDGGPDGLDLTRTCLRVAGAHLTDEAPLLLQVAGEEQARAVAAEVAACASLGLTHRETRHHDRDRAVMLLTRTPLRAGSCAPRRGVCPARRWGTSGP